MEVFVARSLVLEVFVMSSSLRTTLSRVCRRVAAELVVVSSYLIIVIACLFFFFFWREPIITSAHVFSWLQELPRWGTCRTWWSWPRWGSRSLLEVKTSSLLLLAQLHRRAEETHASLYLLREQANLQATPETPPLLPHKRPDSP